MRELGWRSCWWDVCCPSIHCRHGSLVWLKSAGLFELDKCLGVCLTSISGAVGLGKVSFKKSLSYLALSPATLFQSMFR